MSAKIPAISYDPLMFAQLSCSSRSQIARSFKPECFRAANELWTEVREVDDATTAVAAQLLSLACACEGEDALAQDLSDAGYEMCKRLGLFSPPAAQSAQGASLAPVVVGDHSALSRRWRAHIAWGIYNWLRQVPYCHLHQTVLDRLANWRQSPCFPLSAASSCQPSRATYTW